MMYEYRLAAMSNTPGLVDIHVLEETVSRVLTLTKNISSQADGITESSRKSQRALGYKGGQNPNLSHYTKNVNAILDVYSEIERDVRRLAEVQQPIEAGPAKIGLQQYLQSVRTADQLLMEFSNSRTYRNYPALIERARKVRQRGIDRLLRLAARVAATVYVPVDGTLYFGSTEPIPPVPPEELETLAQLLTVLTQYPETRERTDARLGEIMEKYMAQSLSPVWEHVAKTNASGLNIKAFGILCEDLKGVLNDSIKILFGSQDPSRAAKLMAVTTQISQHEMTRFTARIASNDAPRGNVPAGPPDAGWSAGPGPVSPKREEAPRSPQRGQPPSDEARNGPRSLPKIVTESPRGTHAVAAGMLSPGAPQSATSPGGPVVPSSPGGVASPSSIGQSGGFTLFDIIESARVTPIAEEELAKYKRDGLVTLRQVFAEVEQRCRKSPVTSEFAVSPASIQFMQTLKSISVVGRGVEIVLSEVATRAYLTQPFPQWAIRSEPTPDGRANPLSQYYSDLIECLYATLHQLAAENFKNPTKTGVFMLCNMAAIEHYITDSNTETLASIPRKSPLMLALGPVAIQRFQKLMESAFKEYLADWRSLAPFLMEPTLTSATGSAGGKLSGKDREAVKEKFRQFNAEFETLVERQKKYQVADPTLRARMTKEIKALIGPLYYRFYDKHCGGDFTKNLDKYIKWDKMKFDQAIEF